MQLAGTPADGQYVDPTPTPSGTTEPVPYTRAWLVGDELDRMRDAVETGPLSADGRYTERCSRWLCDHVGARHALLVGSCTAALEIAVMVAGIGAGDEVIVPSFTFPSSAAAIARAGAVPVFVDIRPDTLTIDPDRVAAAVTSRTRAIMPVHYAGVAADLEALGRIARRHDLLIIEDAAQGMGSSWRSRPLGSVGELAAVSFHDTKNVTCGQGGALLVNDSRFLQLAEMLRDKGTDRARFFRGEVASYSWMHVGSAYALSELSAAFLSAQLEGIDDITTRRRAVWQRYHDAFSDLGRDGIARLPVVPDDCDTNAHIFHLVLPDRARRDAALERLARDGINAVFHYQPLHLSPAGQSVGRAAGELGVTEAVSDGLLRLPLWPGMDEATIDRVIAATRRALLAGATRLAA